MNLIRRIGQIDNAKVIKYTMEDDVNGYIWQRIVTVVLHRTKVNWMSRSLSDLMFFEDRFRRFAVASRRWS